MKKIYATPLRLIMAIAVIFNMAYLISCKDDEAAPVPVAAFDYETTSELEFGLPLDVQFMDKSTQTDANTTYLWDFGDGSTSTEKSPAHTYSSGGSYTVKFTLKNAEGKANDHSKDIELTSAIVGTWKLDSVAVSSVDSFATKYEIKTAIEFGNHEGWDGSKWMSVGDDGYSTFWSNVIFKGNYLGRKSFFAVEYNFTADGKFTRDEKGKLPAAVYFPEERDYLETEEWVNTEGASLADWKSGEYSWEMKESASYAGRTDLVIDGKKGGFLGLYFAGSESQVPGDSYIYTVSQVNNNQLIVSGVSNLFGNADNLFILKFKKVQ